MDTALIGHTGFVGGNLRRQHEFGSLYRSVDIGEIRGRSFDLVVCAGVQAVKWRANREPEWDRAGIASLCGALSGVEAGRFVLISTIDVYPSPVCGDEGDVPEPVEPYGRHRRELEQWVAERFADHCIVRLPALFGDGLRKNVVYDLLHGREDMIRSMHPRGSFQYYFLDRIWEDLERARTAGLRVLNVSTEPVQTREIAGRFFPGVVLPDADAEPGRYDFRSRSAGYWGGRDGYLYNREQVLDDLGKWLRRWEGADAAGRRELSPPPVS
jgi:nucleoside-diphosphate-sugar epimerase